MHLKKFFDNYENVGFFAHDRNNTYINNTHNNSICPFLKSILLKHNIPQAPETLHYYTENYAKDLSDKHSNNSNGRNSNANNLPQYGKIKNLLETSNASLVKENLNIQQLDDTKQRLSKKENEISLVNNIKTENTKAKEFVPSNYINSNLNGLNGLNNLNNSNDLINKMLSEDLLNSFKKLFASFSKEKEKNKQGLNLYLNGNISINLLTGNTNPQITTNNVYNTDSYNSNKNLTYDVKATNFKQNLAYKNKYPCKNKTNLIKNVNKKINSNYNEQPLEQSFSKAEKNINLNNYNNNSSPNNKTIINKNKKNSYNTNTRDSDKKENLINKKNYYEESIEKILEEDKELKDFIKKKIANVYKIKKSHQHKTNQKNKKDRNIIINATQDSNNSNNDNYNNTNDAGINNAEKNLNHIQNESSIAFNITNPIDDKHRHIRANEEVMKDIYNWKNNNTSSATYDAKDLNSTFNHAKVEPFHIQETKSFMKN